MHGQDPPPGEVLAVTPRDGSCLQCTRTAGAAIIRHWRAAHAHLRKVRT